GAAHHRAADDQPIPQHHQEQLARRRHRRAGGDLDRQHHHESDRPGGRGHRPHHGGLPHLQPRHLALHERLQPRSRAGGALTMTEVLPSEVVIAPERPPASAVGPLAWARANLFNTVFNSVLTVAAAYVILWVVWSLVRWALLDSTWTAA